MRRLKFTLIMFLSVALPLSAFALPFNDDMVHSKNSKGDHMYLSTGQVMRAKPEGAIALGSSSYRVTNKEEADKLVNPLKGDKRSALRGKNLFKVNCSPCHGDIEAATYAPGPVAMKFAAPPDITGEPYRTQRSDGYIYGAIHFGGLAVMPALGWKLSPDEHWDVVNYVRSVQNNKAGAK